jgi:hypothetical protein
VLVPTPDAVVVTVFVPVPLAVAQRVATNVWVPVIVLVPAAVPVPVAVPVIVNVPVPDPVIVAVTVPVPVIDPVTVNTGGGSDVPLAPHVATPEPFVCRD